MIDPTPLFRNPPEWGRLLQFRDERHRIASYLDKRLGDTARTPSISALYLDNRRWRYCNTPPVGIRIHKRM